MLALNCVCFPTQMVLELLLLLCRFFHSFLQSVKITKLQSLIKKDEKNSGLLQLVRFAFMTANIFIPAFLPKRLFFTLLPLGGLQILVHGVEAVMNQISNRAPSTGKYKKFILGRHTHGYLAALLTLNIWAITQWETRKLVPGQLAASFILFGVWLLISVIYCYCKK